ncbi:hypothetical protein [Flexibacterium corallicola]|nr:hypothetical protein [Pseudovibrio sp. M1P-2-3]
MKRIDERLSFQVEERPDHAAFIDFNGKEFSFRQLEDAVEAAILT